MESFNELLSQYAQRLGISDTELGRAVGVSRQTIFRWREGQTARPRQREDVLAIAKKLRLSPEERDRLLLAAGFQPEAMLPEAVAPPPDPDAVRPEQETVGGEPVRAGPALLEPAGGRFRQSVRPGLFIVLAGLVLLLGGSAAWWLSDSQRESEDRATPTAAARLNVPPPPTVSPAAAGETVVLITHFANYASSQVGYNVAGRLAEALQREVKELGLADTRVVILPEIAGERSEALQAGRAISATLVIYGEYDAGRVLVKFAHPANEAIFTDPALLRYVVDLQELSAAINSDLPEQIRSLALLALGQIHLTGREAGQALPLLVQARNNLQDSPTVDPHTLALANFYLATAYHHAEPPVLDEAIAAYNEAVEAWPEMVSSRLNRAAAYELRSRPGDLQRALADAEAVVEAAPEWGVAYYNRAAILMKLGGAENLALALADLEKSLSLKVELPEAYFNRAYIQFSQGQSMAQVAPDLEAALALRPGYGIALNLLCWGYALEQQPETALPYCRQAVKADPDEAAFQDSRGLALALLGNYGEAAADFEAYAAWLAQEQPDSQARQQELSRRRQWIELLKQDENPFTPALLAELRGEFGQ